ncbi:MAG: hypothetical protein GY953_36685 [bacterium]|nr:hypothetical protein [bacterium]
MIETIRGPGETMRGANAEVAAMNREMLSRGLRRRGYEGVTAGDGLTAVSVAEFTSPELVLTDLSPRVIGGLEAALWSR